MKTTSRVLLPALLLTLLVGGAQLATAPLAAAAPSQAGGVAVQENVKSASVTSMSGGSCTWTVSSDVVVINLSSQATTIDGVSYQVSWTAPDGTSGVQRDVTVIYDGGLQAGVTLRPQQRQTFSPVVQFTIPCNADYGDLAVLITTAQGTSSGDAPFMSGSTAVPPTAVGAALLAGAVGLALLAAQRRQPTPH